LATFTLSAIEGKGPTDNNAIILAFGEILGVTFLFTGLSVWALYQPLPPTFIGLILYIGYYLLPLMAHPEFTSYGSFFKLIVPFCFMHVIFVVVKARKQEPPNGYFGGTHGNQSSDSDADASAHK